MFSGPIFRREYLAAARGRRTFLIRALVAAMLGGMALVVGLVVFSTEGSATPDRIGQFGRGAFLASIGAELLLLAFFAPAMAGGAIAEEREKDTLPLLLLTRLTPIEIVLIKTSARWLRTADTVLAGLPIVLAAAWLGGLVNESGLAAVGLLSSAAFMTALAIQSSARHAQAGTAKALATASTFGWLIVVPALTRMPVRTGDLWAELLSLLKAACDLIAPSSPLSLVTDTRWYNTPGGLEKRIALMVALQAGFGLLLIARAAGSLHAREPNPNWTDPTRGYRPPCGDDPIYWREYTLPTRRGAGALIVIRLRYVAILIRAILMSVLTLVGAVLVLAVPIGLLIATIHYVSAAFRELWRHGYGPGGPFDARSDFNWVVRAATGLLAFMPALGLANLVSSKIVAEKDKKNWDVLLTTPLEGDEIVRSKARAAWHGIREWSLAAPAFWALGLACGVVTSLGVALAAIDLALFAWASLAIGLSMSLRPGETSIASSRITTATMLLFAAHAPLLYAALASPRELAAFADWDATWHRGAAVAGLTILIATGILAHRMTRHVFIRFDEWVGRPSRVTGSIVRSRLVPGPVERSAGG